MTTIEIEKIESMLEEPREPPLRKIERSVLEEYLRSLYEIKRM